MKMNLAQSRKDAEKKKPCLSSWRPLRLCARFFLLAAAGCATLGPVRNAGTNSANPGLLDTKPTPQVLVNHLNANAARLASIESDSVAMEIKAGGQQIGVNGVLHCQQPKNFRLRANTVGKTVADIGSN